MLTASQAVLVVVDVQGKLATLMYDKEKFFANVVRMIKGAGVLNIPIIWNEQLPDKLGPTIPEVTEAMGKALPLVKKTFSCCGNDEFNAQLKSTGRRQVLLVGMESHVCVYQTAVDLLRDGFDVYLIADAISSRFAETRQIGIEAMLAAGARIACVEMVLFEMLGTAEGEAFRQCIKIVK